MTHATNPFEFSAMQNTTKSSRKLDYTPQLIALSNKRATELMLTVAKTDELHELGNKMLDDGKVSDLLELLGKVYSADAIKADADILDGCDDEQLARLLESRRSDRSKAKAKGLRQSQAVCVTYISSMFAELLIREKMGKPYQSAAAVEEVDTDDMDAIKRRVKSLQTKTCRLRKLAAYDTAAAKELEDAEAEIARLNSYRPTVHVSGKTTVSDTTVAQLRDVLKAIDASKLTADELERFNALVAKLG